MNTGEIVHEFRAFILKGNVVDLAVGVVIGGAFGKVVDSVVKDLLTPLLAMFGTQREFGAWHIGPFAVGNFTNAVLSFLVIGLVVFLLVVKPMNALKELTRRNAEAQPAHPSPLPEDTRLLMEIRDLLKEAKNARAA